MIIKEENSIFEECMNDPNYRELLNKLPEDERVVILKALREITERFENNLLEPIRKLQAE